ncbi:MAG: HEAT repeat domain-containing protein [bacterium]
MSARTGISAPRAVQLLLDDLHALGQTDGLVELELFAQADSDALAQIAADLGVRLGTVSLEYVLALLKDGSHRRAAICIQSLAAFRTADSLAACGKLLSGSFLTPIRLAAHFLGLFGAVELEEDASFRTRRVSRCVQLLEPLLHHPGSTIQAEALFSLARLGWHGLENRLHGLVADDKPSCRRLALEVVSETRDNEHLDLVLGCFRDDDTETRELAAETALVLLTEIDFAKTATDRVVAALASASPGVAGYVLAGLAESVPDRFMAAAASVSRAESWVTRREAAAAVGRSRHPGAMQLLHGIIRKDSDEDVLDAALKGLARLEPAPAAALALDKLDHHHWKVRAAATWCLGQVHDPALVGRLIKRTRDEDNDVRLAALHALARYDDERVPAELISSLQDTNEQVRTAAEGLLSDEPDNVPSLARLPVARDGRWAWEHVVDQVQTVLAWGQQIGKLLLGKPVRIYQYRQGLGRTGDSKRAAVVEMEISDTPITCGHRHGADIVRGLILHEIGHHLYDIPERGHKTMRGIARSRGVGEIYDILRDERLERKLRARNRQWGRYLDRLASYAFAQGEQSVSLERYAELVKDTPEKTAAAIQQGELPGRLLPVSSLDGRRSVALDVRGVFQVPGLVPPLLLFLTGLRCRFDVSLCRDPKVAAAIAAVPGNLKDLPHREVLKVAQTIGDLIGTRVQQRADLARMQQQMQTLGAGAVLLERALSRLGSSGQVPDWVADLLTGPDAGKVRQERRLPLAQQKSTDLRTFHKRAAGSGPRLFNCNPGREFDSLDQEVTLSFDADLHGQLVASIHKHVRRLRSYFQQLGTRNVDEYAARSGRRLDLARARRGALLRQPNLLVGSREVIDPDLYLGILIDRSGSMRGQELARAKAFGALVCESARLLPGIEGHVNAFDDDTFYTLGDFRNNGIAGLTAGGGNNDAGGLQRAARLAFQSHKENRLLIMISDGMPTACTFESLQNLVSRLTKEYGVVCAQVAVSSLEQIAFPSYVDLGRCSFDESVARFGKLLVRLTTRWR